MTIDKHNIKLSDYQIEEFEVLAKQNKEKQELIENLNNHIKNISLQNIKSLNDNNNELQDSLLTI